MNGATRFFELVQTSKRILLISDGRPDGDSIGSTTAMWAWLSTQEKELGLFCKEIIPRTLRVLVGTDQFTSDVSIFAQPWDLLIIHDASDRLHGGIEEGLPLLPKPTPLINIDHHTTNKLYGDLNIVETNACSTTEVLHRLFTHLGVDIKKDMATSLMAGLLTDTSSFSNGGTTVGGLRAGADLLRKGADLEAVRASLRAGKTLKATHLVGTALSRLKKLPAYDLAVTYLLPEDLAGLADDESKGSVTNILQAINGETEAILQLLDEGKGFVTGSMRSTRRDISRFCQALGGGGHKRAAGFKVPGTLDTSGDWIRVVQKTPEI